MAAALVAALTWLWFFRETTSWILRALLDRGSLNLVLLLGATGVALYLSRLREPRGRAGESFRNHLSGILCRGQGGEPGGRLAHGETTCNPRGAGAAPTTNANGAGLPRRRATSRTSLSARDPSYMCAMMLSPNSEHLISVAPSICRAKS